MTHPLPTAFIALYLAAAVTLWPMAVDRAYAASNPGAQPRIVSESEIRASSVDSEGWGMPIPKRKPG